MLKSWKKFEGSDRITVITLAFFCVVAVIGLLLIR
jgi:hypothetical protein